MQKTPARTFYDLVLWQKSHQFVLAVYKYTERFPAHETYGLSSQLRRAAISVPANIAEGFKKRGLRDKANYYNVAQGSSEEVRYYLILSKDLGYIQEHTVLSDQIDEVVRMLHGLINSIKSV